MPSPKGQPRRRITDDDWDALVDHYRKNPADHAGAAKLINASGATVRRCWEFGQKHIPGRPPIQQIITRENFEMRAELADLRRTQEADRAASKKSDAEDGAIRAQQQVTLRNMRAVGNAGVLVSGKLMGSAMELARSIAADISDPKKALSLKDKMKYANDIAKFSRTMTEVVAMTDKMQRDFDGAPDLTVATVNLGAERALELVMQSSRTADRYRKRVQADGGDPEEQAKLLAAVDSTDEDVLAVKDLMGHDSEDEEDVIDVAPVEYDTTLDDQLVDAGEAVLGDIVGYDQTDTMRPGPHAREVQLGSSSNLTAAHYDSQSQLLWVTFNTGKIYKYSNVTKDVVDDWETAPEKIGRSYGQYFMRHIKDKYNCEQV